MAWGSAGSAVSSPRLPSQRGGSLHGGHAGMCCFSRTQPLSPGSLLESRSLVLILELRRKLNPDQAPSCTPLAGAWLQVSCLPEGSARSFMAEAAQPGRSPELRQLAWTPGFMCHGLSVPCFFVEGTTLQRGAGLQRGEAGSSQGTQTKITLSGSVQGERGVCS